MFKIEWFIFTKLVFGITDAVETDEIDAIRSVKVEIKKVTEINRKNVVASVTKSYLTL